MQGDALLAATGDRYVAAATSSSGTTSGLMNILRSKRSNGERRRNARLRVAGRVYCAAPIRTR